MTTNQLIDSFKHDNGHIDDWGGDRQAWHQAFGAYAQGWLAAEKTLKPLGTAYAMLSEIAEKNNDVVEESNERGRNNAGLGLICFENGSGMLVEFNQPLIDDQSLSNPNILQTFKSVSEFEKWVSENGS